MKECTGTHRLQSHVRLVRQLPWAADVKAPLTRDRWPGGKFSNKRAMCTWDVPGWGEALGL